MNGRVVARRAVPAAVATAAVVALLANVRARPPSIAAPAGAGRQPPPISATVEPDGPAREQPGARRSKGPVRSATETATTPFSIIQLRVTLTGGELTRVETLELSGDNARTEAINARAEPILREEALKAGGAATSTSSAARRTRAAATASRCRRRSTGPGRVADGLHRVEEVMGIPVGIDVRDDGVEPARARPRLRLAALGRRRRSAPTAPTARSAA